MQQIKGTPKEFWNIKHLRTIILFKKKKLHHNPKVKETQNSWAKLKLPSSTFSPKQWPQQLHERMRTWAEWEKAAVYLHGHN